MVARTTTAPTSILGDATELALLLLGVAEAEEEDAGDAAAVAASPAAATEEAEGAEEAGAEAEAASSAGVRSWGIIMGVVATELRSKVLLAVRSSGFMPMVLRVKRTLVANRECDHAGRADMSKSSPQVLAALLDEVTLLLYAA